MSDTHMSSPADLSLSLSSPGLGTVARAPDSHSLRPLHSPRTPGLRDHEALGHPRAQRWTSLEKEPLVTIQSGRRSPRLLLSCPHQQPQKQSRVQDAEMGRQNR